jgi:beta-galactosidase
MQNRREFLKDLAATGVAVTFSGIAANAEEVVTTPPMTIGQTVWPAPRFSTVLGADWRCQQEPDNAPADFPAAQPGFDDAGWESVGVPHCYNDTDTFQNAPESNTLQGTVWYRRRLPLDAAQRGKRVFLEFQGVNLGVAVYVNGKFQPGKTAVPQPGEVTHVGGFLPFVLDITDSVHFGPEPNLLAVRVCNISGTTGYGGFGGKGPTPGNVHGKMFFTDPHFATYLGFGMGCGGLLSPVALHVTHPVHVPFNAYSPLQKWGTYVATISASPASAQLRFQTNVENESDAPQEVTLLTRVYDAANRQVLTLKEEKHTIAPKEIALFDQSATLDHPQLWYPNNSPYGKPVLYRVTSEVKLAGITVDAVSSPLGIRTITWDDKFCYVNGKKHVLNGFGQRNIYPALGSAIPAELQWNDIRLIAECGGNALRVGHVPALPETVEACDAYGVLIINNSGDNEWACAGEPAMTYKKEYDRDMIIRYRNHPSIAVWESNNGLNKMANPHYSPKDTNNLVDQWDYLQPRIVSSRDDSDYWPTDRKIMIGYTNDFKKIPGSPSIDMEVYGGHRAKDPARSVCMARFDYADEKEFADYFVGDYLSDIGRDACGWVAWMLAEGQGESFLMYLNGMTNQRSLGSCAMDGNRFPKISYQIFKHALWIPYATRPGVVLQSHWNLDGIQNVDAWSNCPAVELYLNGASLGVRVPDAKKRCTWPGVAWQSGALKAVGLDETGHAVCSDTRQTSGPAQRILLRAEPRLTKPSGEKFKLTANGSDCAIVTACIVDAQNNWCPLADNNIRFKVEGPAQYRGSYNFYVTPGKPIGYHSPGDAELQAEGGLMRVAIRSTFAPGTVRVTAEADGLGEGIAAFGILPVSA